jgi:hypothetical protein
MKGCNVCVNAEMGSMDVGKSGRFGIENMHMWWMKKMRYYGSSSD